MPGQLLGFGKLKLSRNLGALHYDLVSHDFFFFKSIVYDFINNTEKNLYKDSNEINQTQHA